MVRIPLWCYILLLPIVFFSGCTTSIPLVWSWMERSWVQPVGVDRDDFPVLVVDAAGTYSVAPLGDLPQGSKIVLDGFDPAAINRDFNGSIDSSGNHLYFRVLSQGPDRTEVSLEVPTLHDSKLQGWYEIKRGLIVPTKILQYGPGFAFVVLPWSLSCGLASVAIFALIVRPKRKPRSAHVA